DNLPAPKGGRFDDLPMPRDSNVDLPGLRDSNVDLPVPKGGHHGGGALTTDPSIAVDTGQLRDAEKAKLNVARQRSRRETSVFRTVTIIVVVLLVIAAGVGLNFIKPAWGYFGYKLVFKPKETVAVVKPAGVLEAPPPPVA